MEHMLVVLDSLSEQVVGSQWVADTLVLLLHHSLVEKMVLKARLFEAAVDVADEVILVGCAILSQLMPLLILHFCVHIEQNDDLHHNGSMVLFACSPLLNGWCSAGT